MNRNVQPYMSGGSIISEKYVTFWILFIYFCKLQPKFLFSNVTYLSSTHCQPSIRAPLENPRSRIQHSDVDFVLSILGNKSWSVSQHYGITDVIFFNLKCCFPTKILQNLRLRVRQLVFTFKHVRIFKMSIRNFISGMVAF